MDMPHTQLKYMEQMDLFEDSATILDIQNLEDGRKAVILDQTIFYPQGGGQPYDQGTISSKEAEFSVEEVRFKEGIVYHIGTITKGTLEKNASVSLRIDKDRRMFNSRNHTAGHLIDLAVRILGIDLIPSRGYHFPEGAYVEYQGTLQEATREILEKNLEQEANRMVAASLPVRVQMVTREELETMASYVPEYVPQDKPSRAMIVHGYSAIPCGGTHVPNTNSIGFIAIDKIKNKKGNTRISYSIKATS